MLLKDKVAVIYGGGGAVGGAIARTFAGQGARVWLAGRTARKTSVVRDAIVAAGGEAHAAEVDALDEAAVERHAESVVAAAGRIDIAVNAIGLAHVQGKRVFELSLEEFEAPLHGFMRAEFLTARAAARRMAAQGSGVLLAISTQSAKLAFEGVLGFGVTCGAIETFTRLLAADLAASGIRVVCLRSDAIPETLALGSYARDVFEGFASRAGTTVEQMLAPGTSASLLKRYPRLADIANAAAFVASEHGGALNGTVVNLTGGVVPE